LDTYVAIFQELPTFGNARESAISESRKIAALNLSRLLAKLLAIE
jgi:hypothetical protein